MIVPFGAFLCGNVFIVVRQVLSIAVRYHHPARSMKLDALCLCHPERSPPEILLRGKLRMTRADVAEVLQMK